MKFHRTGRLTILFMLALWILSVVLVIAGPFFVLMPVISGLLFVVLCLVLNFFRNPPRPITEPGEQMIYAPADGKVVAIEETTESEYFHDKRLQVSIFMSPLNVHANRFPVSGKVEYLKHHHGKYLVAWHPKSSTENERVTYVLHGKHGMILLRQIAGAVARRIIPSVRQGDNVQQGGELGFIKFGSRLDMLLPTNTEIQVEIGTKTKGNVTVIGRLPGG